MQKPPDINPKSMKTYQYEYFRRKYNIFDTNGQIRSLEKNYIGDTRVDGKVQVHDHGDEKKMVDPRIFYIFPSVHAAAPKDAPKRPPPMKYKDLPIYQSPHYEYKDYIEDKKKCPKANVKILQTYLYPTVQYYRKSLTKSIGGMAKEICLMRGEIKEYLRKQAKEYKQHMRANENLNLRRGVVAGGTLAGLYLGSGTRSTTKKLVGMAVGALTTGALCFPKETDVIFRNVAFQVGNMVLKFFNMFCSKRYSLGDRLPCTPDKPPPPQPLPADKVNKCEKK